LGSKPLPGPALLLESAKEAAITPVLKEKQKRVNDSISKQARV
jgi:hypothetical protein